MTISQRVRVFIVDDHPMYREGVANAIRQRPELELVGAAGDGRAALADLGRLRPDVALLDIQMAELDGIALVAALRRDGVPTRAICLSAYYDHGVVHRALAAGALGFLSKDATAHQICDAVLAVSRGQTVLGPDIQTAVAEAIRRREPALGSSLSPRELEVLRLTSDGLSAPEIAAQLHLSATTVKTHLQRGYEKLDVSDRASAVKAAMRLGLLE